MPRHSLLKAIASICLACASVAAAEPATGSKPSPDVVKVDVLPRPCQWINTQKAHKVLGADSISITASAKTDLYNDLESGDKVGNAPMLVFTPDKTFVLTAKIAVDFKQEFDGGFLIVYGDSDHWAKLLFEKSHYGPFSVCSNVTNGLTDDTVNGDIPGKEVFLRIARSGDLFVFYSSLDGVKWTYLRYFKLPFKGELKVGFASQSPAGEQCTTVFSKVHYAAKASGDFWSGEPAK